MSGRGSVWTAAVASAALVLAACATAPAAKSPLREALAGAGSSDVEAAARKCLVQGGWKVDAVGGYSGGSNVVSAYKAKDQTDVYIHASDQKPRITGGPDEGNPFWKCLAGELGAGGGDKEAEKAGADKDKGGGDKDKGAAPAGSSEPSP